MSVIKQLLDNLNDAQRQAVETESPRLLVLAGAGSGKTGTLVHRMAWDMLVRNRLPGQILAVTFTNKAAKEMQHRLTGLMNRDIPGLWIGTFHAIAHKLLRHHAVFAHLPEAFQIIDSEDQLRLIKQLVKQHGLDEESMPAKKVAYFISRHKEEAKRAKDCVVNTQESYILQSLYLDYEQQCFRQGLVDFSELLFSAYDLLRNNPNILYHYQEKFAHILVDEFQDTNTIQYLWLKQLIHPANAVTVVGDDDQSIYGWRGARVENIEQFTKDYHGVEVVRLEQNYRSTQTILNAANHLIAQNEDRMGKKLWTDIGGAEKIKVYAAFNEVDEARFIVNNIASDLKNGTFPQDVAVLYRSNAQSRILEQLLRQYNIPYRVYGGVRFFERAEIKDALAYLRLIRYTDDDPAFERVINTPTRGIGERTLEKIREIARTQQTSLWQAANQYVMTAVRGGKAVTQLSEFLRMIEALAALQIPLPALLEAVYSQTGLILHYQAQSGDRGDSKVDNLGELLVACQQYAQSSEVAPHQLLTQFLSDCALEAGTDTGEDTPAIQLMTVHSAKGLEFKKVFIAGLEEGLFPHRHSMEDRKKLEEERRLCYVGITRAMRQLTLSYAMRRNFGNHSSGTRVSRFLQEIPRTLLEPVNMVSHGIVTHQPSMPSPALHAILDTPFQIGKRVLHPKFGEGVILKQEGRGDSLRLQIQFQQAGCRWLMASHAPIELLDTFGA